jgi:predicted dehydrogenase
MKIGAIGIDSSHLPEFTKRIKAMNAEGKTKCLVTHFWDPGTHEWQHPEGPERSKKDVEGWRSTAADLGAKQVGSIEELLKNVDGVMVLNINGHRHLELSVPSLAAGKPTYVDKPLTCSIDQAKALLNISRQYKARCYSASSLRFITEIPKIPRDALGKIVAIDAFGNGELLDMMPGLWHYGCHTIEMIDAIWGPGVKRVSAIEFVDRHLVDLDYHDGRYARLRLERKGSWAFGATLHGEKAVHQFTVDFGPVYTRLVEGMTRFFEGGQAPVDLRDIVETVAVMQAGNESIRRQGEWIEIPTIR